MSRVWAGGARRRCCRDGSAAHGFRRIEGQPEAIALAEALKGCDDIDDALARYDAQRASIAERIMMHGRKLGVFLGVNVRTEEDRTMAKLLSDHYGQMDWMAVPNFIANSPQRSPRAHSDIRDLIAE